MVAKGYVYQGAADDAAMSPPFSTAATVFEGVDNGVRSASGCAAAGSGGAVGAGVRSREGSWEEKSKLLNMNGPESSSPTFGQI